MNLKEGHNYQLTRIFLVLLKNKFLTSSIKGQIKNILRNSENKNRYLKQNTEKNESHF